MTQVDAHLIAQRVRRAVEEAVLGALTRPLTTHAQAAQQGGKAAEQTVLAALADLKEMR